MSGLFGGGMGMILVLILVGGWIKIGDKSLLQIILDMIMSLFKPAPVPPEKSVAAKYGAGVGTGILDWLKGLLGNGNIGLLLMVGLFFMLSVSGCGGSGLGGCSSGLGGCTPVPKPAAPEVAPETPPAVPATPVTPVPVNS